MRICRDFREREREFTTTHRDVLFVLEFVQLKSDFSEKKKIFAILASPRPRENLSLSTNNVTLIRRARAHTYLLLLLLLFKKTKTRKSRAGLLRLRIFIDAVTVSLRC